MKRIGALILASAISMGASAQVPPDTAKATALKLVDHLDAGRYTQAEGMFSGQLQKLVPEDKLKDAWSSMAPGGERGESKAVLKEGKQVVLIPMRRGEQDWVAIVSVNASNRVDGLFIQPQTRVAPVPPVPANANFSEKELSVGKGTDALSATLAMPKGEGPFPAVVLVHGSGPQDRNETIGANRPFLDVARALADNGIAVLRYEKRSYEMPEWYAKRPVTIDNETTDDAVLALATLRAQPGIDRKRVFVMGHSQGAMVAPRIAERDGHVAGLIQWAGPARKLIDLLPEQTRFLGKSQKQPQAAIDESIRGLEKAIKDIRDPSYTGPSIMGQSVSYWRTVDAVDPMKATRDTQLPVLILQGGRDFQVTETDWRLWQKNFSDDKRVTLKRYADLNHLGIAGTGELSMSEYEKPGHVDATLISDVAKWIKKF